MDLAERKRLLDERIKRGSMDLREGADSFLQDRIVNPMYNAGFENLGPAIGAAGSAAIEYVTPESTTDIALSLIPGGKQGGQAVRMAEKNVDRMGMLKQLQARFPNDPAKVQIGLQEFDRTAKSMSKMGKAESAIDAMATTRAVPDTTVREATTSLRAPAQTAKAPVVYNSAIGASADPLSARAMELLRKRAAEGL